MGALASLKWARIHLPSESIEKQDADFYARLTACDEGANVLDEQWCLDYLLTRGISREDLQEEVKMTPTVMLHNLAKIRKMEVINTEEFSMPDMFYLHWRRLAADELHRVMQCCHGGVRGADASGPRLLGIALVDICEKRWGPPETRQEAWQAGWNPCKFGLPASTPRDQEVYLPDVRGEIDFPSLLSLLTA